MGRRVILAINVLIVAATAAILGVAVFGPGSQPASAAGIAATHNHASSIPTSASVPVTTGAPVTAPPSTTPSVSDTKPVVTSPVTSHVAVTTVPVAHTDYAYPTYPTYPSYLRYGSTTSTSSTSTTSTSIAVPIGGRLPVTPSTLPLATTAPNAHVSPVFAALSGAGLFLTLVIVVVQLIRTRASKQ